jgi:hypothetical protein
LITHSLEPDATAKMLAVEFAGFFGLEFSVRANMPGVVHAITGARG